MKDPKNIEVLNKLVMSYITLHGLQGKSLNPNDPFAIYFARILMSSMSPFGSGAVISITDDRLSTLEDEIKVPSTILHPIIKLAYDFYCEIDDIDNTVNPMMKEQVKYQLGDINFDEFLESSVETYKKSLFDLLNNYNSKKEEYNKIKIDILNDKMQESIEIEDYEMAAEMRDKIKELENKI